MAPFLRKYAQNEKFYFLVKSSNVQRKTYNVKRIFAPQ